MNQLTKWFSRTGIIFDLVCIIAFCAIPGLAPFWRQQWTAGDGILSFICDVAYFLVGLTAIFFGTVAIQGSVRRIREHHEASISFGCAAAHQWDILGGVVIFACGLLGSLAAFGLYVPFAAGLPLTVLSIAWLIWIGSREKLSCDPTQI